MKALDKHTYGPTTESFKTLVAETLREEEVPMRKKKMPLVLITALLVMLLAATALAVALNAQEQKNTAMRVGKEAVGETYGFSNSELASSFREEAKLEKRDGKDVWVVDVLPVLYFEELGDYQVTLDAESMDVLTTHWTHEGADLSQLSSGEFASPVWGPKQLERLHNTDDIISTQMELMEAELGEFAKWSLEDKAKFSQIVLDLEHPKEDMFYNILPGEGEMNEAEAVETAWQMINEKYGVDVAIADKFDYEVEYLTVKEWDENQWGFYFYPKEGEDAEALGEYRVQFFVPSLTQDLCLWYIDDFWAHVPDLIAKGKLDPVYERVNTIYFDDLSLEDKAEYTRVLREAGYDLSEFEGIFAVPGESDLTQAEATKLATEALGKAYGFSDRALSLFESHASFEQRGNNPPSWVLTFDPIDYVRYINRYQVILSPDGKRADSSIVSQIRGRDLATPSPADKELPFGQKKAWTATDIETMLSLVERSEAVLEASRKEHGKETLEAWALHDEMWREAGFDAPSYSHSLPRDGDLTVEEAIQLARDTIAEKYDLSTTEADALDVEPEYLIQDPVRPVWRMFPNAPGADYTYYIELDAATGDVLMLDAFEANG